MKIGIISLGLIGGSLFKCLVNSDNQIYAQTRNLQTIQEAKKLSEFVSDDINSLKDCDVIFVASPINKTLEILEKLNNIVKNSCIVLDCASVKQFVMEKDYNFIFIGSHPMAGTEHNGYNNSFKELFEGAKWVLTPSPKATKENIETVQQIINYTGAKTIISDAKTHDEAVALISHMPLLVAQALFKTANDNQLAMKLASSGFRDMTRLCMSNLEMAQDMRNFNNFNINKAVDELIFNIKTLKDNEESETFEKIKDNRKIMYSKDGRNILD